MQNAFYKMQFISFSVHKWLTQIDESNIDSVSQLSWDWPNQIVHIYKNRTNVFIKFQILECKKLASKNPFSLTKI